MNLLKKISEVINPSNSGKENREIVPVEVELEDSEDENIDNKFGIKALPNKFKFSNQMINTIGILMSSKNSLKIIKCKNRRSINKRNTNSNIGW